MNPNTTITAEILANLDKCPFCGAGRLHCTRSELTLECGTYLRIGNIAEKERAIGCYGQENEIHRARVKELEEALSWALQKGWHDAMHSVWIRLPMPDTQKDPMTPREVAKLIRYVEENLAEKKGAHE